MTDDRSDDILILNQKECVLKFCFQFQIIVLGVRQPTMSHLDKNVTNDPSCIYNYMQIHSQPDDSETLSHLDSHSLTLH